MHIYDLKREPETVKYILYGEKLMKKEIPFIDIADVNCWMVYLMPLTQDQRSNYELTDSIQQACIHDKVFGMGWDVEVPGFSKETPMTDENALKYVKTYSCGGYKVSDAAVNGYKEVKKGDYAIARNKNGHYYVGKVSSEGAHYLYDAGKTLYRNFSWSLPQKKRYLPRSSEDSHSGSIQPFRKYFLTDKECLSLPCTRII